VNFLPLLFFVVLLLTSFVVDCLRCCDHRCLICVRYYCWPVIVVMGALRVCSYRCCCYVVTVDSGDSPLLLFCLVWYLLVPLRYYDCRRCYSDGDILRLLPLLLLLLFIALLLGDLLHCCSVVDDGDAVTLLLFCYVVTVRWSVWCYYALLLMMLFIVDVDVVVAFDDAFVVVVMMICWCRTLMGFVHLLLMRSTLCLLCCDDWSMRYGIPLFTAFWCLHLWCRCADRCCSRWSCVVYIDHACGAVVADVLFYLPFLFCRYYIPLFTVYPDVLLPFYRVTIFDVRYLLPLMFLFCVMLIRITTFYLPLFCWCVTVYSVMVLYVRTDAYISWYSTTCCYSILWYLFSNDDVIWVWMYCYYMMTLFLYILMLIYLDLNILWWWWYPLFWLYVKLIRAMMLLLIYSLYRADMWWWYWWWYTMIHSVMLYCCYLLLLLFWCSMMMFLIHYLICSLRWWCWWCWCIMMTWHYILWPLLYSDDTIPCILCRWYRWLCYIVLISIMWSINQCQYSIWLCKTIIATYWWKCRWHYWRNGCYMLTCYTAIRIMLMEYGVRICINVNVNINNVIILCLNKWYVINIIMSV